MQRVLRALRRRLRTQEPRLRPHLLPDMPETDADELQEERSRHMSGMSMPDAHPAGKDRESHHKLHGEESGGARAKHDKIRQALGEAKQEYADAGERAERSPIGHDTSGKVGHYEQRRGA